MKKDLSNQNKEIKEQILDVEITKELQDSYLDYAMSVIISRALPDVRDGLKPVHRRILYSMHKLGLHSSAKYLKSANVVGDVLGKYHPHGDMAVYDSLVRMAQDFSLRYPLIDGQGNFGSIDGDAAAAYRYTESRLAKIAEEMLVDIEKETVDFVPNYDGRYQEPVILPTKIPQLLLNGSMGIAVGMATNIPPHNISEVMDGLVYLLDNPNASVEDLNRIILGPDFPTGGFIYNQNDILEAYRSGKGSIVMSAKTDIREIKPGHYQIIINEIPYQVNKAELIVKIAQLVKDKKIEGIKNIKDESDREGLRIVIDLKSEAYPQKVLNSLFKLTDLRKTFHVNMLALIDGIQPQVLSLKDILGQFISHRKEIVRRRTEFDLNKAKERAHILEGLNKALNNIDAVIKTIKKSESREAAHKNLMSKFKLTSLQANAILEMKLQTLAALERKKILEELKEKQKLIKELTLILKSPKKITDILKREFKEIKEKYGDLRRTKIIKSSVSEIKEVDLVPVEDVVIILTQSGYIKRVDLKTWKIQKRGGKGIIGISPTKEDAVDLFLSCSTHDNLLFFTNLGRVFETKAYEIPEASRISRGRALVNFLNLGPNEKVNVILSIGQKSEKTSKNYFVIVTKNGIIKKTSFDVFKKIRKSGMVAIKLKRGDSLSGAKIIKDSDEILLVTKLGQSIKFKSSDIRPMGRAATGVRAINLKKGDEVIGIDIVSKKDVQKEILIITRNGFGKKTKLSNFRLQRRGGSGLKAAKITNKNGHIVSTKILEDEESLILISKKGQVIRINLKDVPMQGRVTQGVRLMRLDKDDEVVSAICA